MKNTNLTPQMENHHQVMFKSIGDYATDVHFHHVKIPIPLKELMETPRKSIKLLETYKYNIYPNALKLNVEVNGARKDNTVAKQAAELITNQNSFVYNNAVEQLLIVADNLQSVVATLPEANERSKRQIGLLFGIGGTLFAAHNYLSIQNLGRKQTAQGKMISSLTNIVEIQENHLQHLDIAAVNSQYLQMLSLQFNPALMASAAQNIVFKTDKVTDKLLDGIQQLQVHRLSTNLLLGKTVTKIYMALKEKAENQHMELLISAPSDLFQVEVSYFYKPEKKEINIFVHIPMVKPNKMLKFFQYIKFPMTQTIGQNYSLMPHMEKDLLAVGADHQFKILSQSDLTSCNKYASTYLCKGRDVMRTDLDATCLGAYYLQNKENIVKQCKFDIVAPAECRE